MRQTRDPDGRSAMRSFSIHFSGETLDIDRVLLQSPLKFDRVYRRGEPHTNVSGVEIDLSGGRGEALSFDGQQAAAIEYLAAHSAALLEMARFPGVERRALMLLHNCLPGEDVVGYFVGLDPRLLRLTLELGLHLSLHVSLRYERWSEGKRREIRELGSDAKPVLIGAAILAYVPRDAEGNAHDSIVLDQAAAALRDAAGRVASRFIGCEYEGGSYSCDLAYENAVRCTRCNDWASDLAADGHIDGITIGRFADGRFLCVQCHEWERYRLEHPEELGWAGPQTAVVPE